MFKSDRQRRAAFHNMNKFASRSERYRKEGIDPLDYYIDKVVKKPLTVEGYTGNEIFLVSDVPAECSPLGVDYCSSAPLVTMGKDTYILAGQDYKSKDVSSVISEPGIKELLDNFTDDYGESGEDEDPEFIESEDEFRRLYGLKVLVDRERKRGRPVYSIDPSRITNDIIDCDWRFIDKKNVGRSLFSDLSDSQKLYQSVLAMGLWGREGHPDFTSDERRRWQKSYDVNKPIVDEWLKS